ncbi:MAG: hypothetical protein V3T72_13795 [Thermoanaerobaculia bacterium]
MRHTFLVGLGIVTLAAAAFGGWWLQDVRVEASWNPDWPRAVRITGESVEKIVIAAGGAVTEGDRARAAERARWKAYYYAQLRAAEQLGSLEISAQTSIRDLTELDQELKASFAGALQAAVEVDSATEILDDSVKARVTVEIPAEPLRDLKTVIAEALRAGRISIERRPRPREPAAVPDPVPPQVHVADTPRPETESAANDDAAPAAPHGSQSAAKDPVTEPEVEEPTDDTADEMPAIVARRPPRPAPTHTGAAVHLGEQPYRLGVTSVLYELGGTEIGSVLDLPPERLTAGFFPIADPGDTDAIHRLVGGSPRDLEATISGRDLFLTERLSSEEVRQLQQWLRAGKVVVVLG